MRLELPQRHVTISPGSSASVDLEVFNTGTTIDGVVARIVGLDAAWVTSDPGQLALFPETSGRLRLQISLPPEFPAGEHVVSVEVSSSVNPEEVVYADLRLEVFPLSQATVMVLPATVIGRRKGKFSLLTENTGNTPISLTMSGTDPERSLRFTFAPPTVDVGPGESINTGMLVQGPRHLWGSDDNHAITILAESVDFDTEARGVFTQRPVLPRGPLTALVLAAIVLLWALALLAGLSRTLGNDPLSKAAPASFFAGIPNGTPGKPTGTAAPAGAVQKTGAASKDLGGTITGTVRAQNTQAGVGRITVEAIRQSRNGPVLVSSAATAEDGTYAVGGLLPGTYVLRFSSQGFHDVWFPNAAGMAGAAPVDVSATNPTKGTDVVIDGLPGSISGQVDTGSTSAPVPVSVLVHPIVNNVPGLAVATVSVDPSKSFAVPNLATPGTYEIDISAPGYQPATIVQQLNGGQAAVTNLVQLSASPGSVSGLVTDGVNPLGGVVVTAIAGDKSVTTATPTSGAVGRFSLNGLVSPQTYLLTFTKQGFGSQTIAVDLGPGENRDNISVSLTGGTGSISGRALDSDGTTGIGDVTVTVTGGTTSLTTRTLTAGATGTYFLSGLPTPGDYTVTFTAPGRATETVPVSLSSSGLATNVNSTMPSTLGTLSGVITDGTNGVVNATISLTDGTNVRTTTSTSVPTAGSFQLAGILPGTYTVTVTAPGYKQRSAIVTVNPGDNGLPSGFQLDHA